MPVRRRQVLIRRKRDVAPVLLLFNVDNIKHVWNQVNSPRLRGLILFPDGVFVVALMTITSEPGEPVRRAHSAGFWRAQVAGWSILLVLGFCIRLVIFGNVEASFWLTLAMEPLAFALTSAAAVWHGRYAPKGASLAIVLACAVLLCAAAS